MPSVIPDSWQVPQRFRDRIGPKAGRQRAMIEGKHLLLVLHGVPGGAHGEREARLFWREPKGEWRTNAGKGDALKALTRHVESFRDALAALDEKASGTADVHELFAVIQAATPIVRTTKNLHKALQEAREGIDDKDLIPLRDLAGDCERAAELTLTDARDALAHAHAGAAEAQVSYGKRTLAAQHRLNMLGAIFLPVTAVAAILGTPMNTGFEGASPIVFWGIIAVAFGLGFALRGSIDRI